VPQQDVHFTKNKITFKNVDGSSGEMNLKVGNTDPYYYNNGATKGVCFVGTFQTPAGSGSGGLDFEGTWKSIPLANTWLGTYGTELGWGGFKNWTLFEPLIVTLTDISFGSKN